MSAVFGGNSEHGFGNKASLCEGGGCAKRRRRESALWYPKFRIMANFSPPPASREPPRRGGRSATASGLCAGCAASAGARAGLRRRHRWPAGRRRTKLPYRGGIVQPGQTRAPGAGLAQTARGSGLSSSGAAAAASAIKISALNMEQSNFSSTGRFISPKTSTGARMAFI